MGFADCRVLDGPAAGATIRATLTSGQPPATLTLSGVSYERVAGASGGFDYRMVA